MSISCDYCVLPDTVPVTGQSLVHNISNEFSNSECDLETSTMRNPRFTRAFEP